MRGLLGAGDPNGEVADCYTAAEAVRELCSFINRTGSGSGSDRISTSATCRENV